MTQVMVVHFDGKAWKATQVGEAQDGLQPERRRPVASCSAGR